MKFLALIPAYEPEEHMIPLLEDLKQRDFEIIVVDDGSGKDYEPIFTEAKEYATVITCHKNGGKGKALRIGFSYIKENYDDDTVVVTLDCDGQHKPEDAEFLARCVNRDKKTIYIGSREIPKSSPLRSRFGNAVTRVWFKLITGKKLHDTQTGLRAFPKEYMDLLLEGKGDRYEYEMGTLIAATESGILIKEIPIETIYINNNENSHFNPVPDTLKIWKTMFKFSDKLLIKIGIVIGILILGIICISCYIKSKNKEK